VVGEDAAMSHGHHGASCLLARHGYEPGGLFFFLFFFFSWHNVMLPIPSYIFFLLLIPTNLCMKRPKKMPHFGQKNFDRPTALDI